MTKFKVLSIDAWADCCGCECKEDTPTCWTWNNWFNAGEYDEMEYGILNEENALKFFTDGVIKPGRAHEFEIDDDQYNLVLINKKTRMPLYAIEYGSKE